MECVWHEEIHAFRRRHDFTTASVTRPWERFSTALAHESVKTGFDDDSFATRKKKKTVVLLVRKFYLYDVQNAVVLLVPVVPVPRYVFMY